MQKNGQSPQLRDKIRHIRWESSSIPLFRETSLSGRINWDPKNDVMRTHWRVDPSFVIWANSQRRVAWRIRSYQARRHWSLMFRKRVRRCIQTNINRSLVVEKVPGRMIVYKPNKFVSNLSKYFFQLLIFFMVYIWIIRI